MQHGMHGHMWVVFLRYDLLGHHCRAESSPQSVCVSLKPLASHLHLKFDETRTALLNATSTKTGPKKNRTVIKEDEVVIFTPMFLNTEDEVGSAPQTSRPKSVWRQYLR